MKTFIRPQAKMACGLMKVFITATPVSYEEQFLLEFQSMSLRLDNPANSNGCLQGSASPQPRGPGYGLSRLSCSPEKCCRGFGNSRKLR